MIKEEAGHERLGQQSPLFPPSSHLSHPIHPLAQQRWGEVCPPSGVTGDDSLPRGEERGGSSAPKHTGPHERGTFFSSSFFF